MLQSAAPAGTKMFTDWINAFVARPVDVQQMPAVRMAADRFDRDDLTRESVGHINRPFRCICNAISAMAEAADGELLSHIQPRAGILRCRRRLRSVRG